MATTPTLAQILAAITKLKAVLKSNIQSVNGSIPSPTPPQQGSINQLIILNGSLQDDLNHASLSVSTSSDPVAAWALWFATIKPDLQSFDKLLNSLLTPGDPNGAIGVCTYIGGTDCMTQEQCLSLPGGVWSSGGCVLP